MSAAEFQRLAERFNDATSGASPGADDDLEPLMRFDRTPPSFLTDDAISSLALVRAYLFMPEPGGASPTPRVAGFTVLRTLGEGGMGVVFEAEQERPRRRVAIKVMRWGRYAGPEQVARFEREIDALGRLQHPRIVSVFQAGRTEDGELFYTMECVEGERLDRWLPGRALADRLRVVALLCDGVQHAHDHGVVHRDLKPANIVVSESGEPKILDYGLARLHGLDAEPRATVTRAGGLCGSLAYMSPERVSGGADSASAACDVYALGAILYECATGAPAFDVAGSPWAEAVSKVERGEFRRPSDVSRDVSPSLEAVILRAMAREPAARYASADALGQDLRLVLEGRFCRIARPAGSARRRAALLVAGVATVALGAVAVPWAAREGTPPAQETSQLESGLRPSTQRPGREGEYWLGPRLRVRDLAAAESEYRARLTGAGADASDSGPAVGHLALILEAQGRYAEAEELFRRNIEDGDPNRRSVALSRLARCMSAAGKLEEAEAIFRDIEGASLNANTPPPVAIEMRCARAEHLVRLSAFQDAEAILLRAAALAEGGAAFSAWSQFHVAESLIDLYGAWGKPGLADRWRERIERIEG